MTQSMSDDWYDGALPPDEALEKRMERAHPSPEQALLRAAVASALTVDQRKIWELWNYDRLTQAEIADKFGVSQQAVGQRIGVIERKLTVWCREHKEVYDAISGAKDGKQD